jgi:F-type H+-transporting ATPase subunit a
MEKISISIKAEKIFDLFGFPITNSIIMTWLVMCFLIIFSFFVTRKLSKIPSRIQLIGELLVGGIFSFFETILGRNTKKVFPLIGTLFIFIIFLNWFGLIPGVGTIGIYEMENSHKVFIPLFRAGSADLNTTLALAIIAVFTIQYFGVTHAKMKYFSHFINFRSPIDFFVGILEFIGEFTKIISFAFRLFGNIFAGEVLLTVIAFLIPFIAPLPFLMMELFIGFIQALVFSMLTTVFISMAINTGEH